ncbi:MAG: hypothetical protein ACJAT2_001493 [Bacteriovoracaceae bacterium]|jgi:hypothetical protein
MRNLCLLFILLISSTAQAFILINREYRLANAHEVKLQIASGGCVANGISNDELKGYIEEMLDDYWNTVTDSRLYIKFEEGDSGRSLSENGLPGQIIVGCDPLGSSGPSGFATRNDTNNGCSVTLNGTTLVPGGFTREGMMGLIIHEFGHCVGLGHSDDPASVMTYRTTPWVQPKRLSRDDMDGVAYLYPYESKAGIFGSCSVIASEDAHGRQEPFFLSLLMGLLLAAAIRFSYKLGTHLKG